jgi:predicted SPOUT superfamily RNA methylase MTH1
MSTYSFLDVVASIVGPGLNAQIGSTSGSAKEGITAEFDEDKATVTTGADGSIMTSLRATQTGKITIRLLKTSPVNAVLSQAYAFQRQNAVNWGNNLIRVVDKARGDVCSGRQMTFTRFPTITWSEDGNINEWAFQGILNEVLGAGIPDVTTP